MKERVHQLDFLKGIFILLMVAFHNFVIGDGSEHISQEILKRYVKKKYSYGWTYYYHDSICIYYYG